MTEYLMGCHQLPGLDFRSSGLSNHFFVEEHSTKPVLPVYNKIYQVEQAIPSSNLMGFPHFIKLHEENSGPVKME